jgi:hypothetical protein
MEYYKIVFYIINYEIKDVTHVTDIQRVEWAWFTVYSNCTITTSFINTQSNTRYTHNIALPQDKTPIQVSMKNFY